MDGVICSPLMEVAASSCQTLAPCSVPPYRAYCARSPKRMSHLSVIVLWRFCCTCLVKEEVVVGCRRILS